jgi:glutamyl-tRNA synthetase
MREKAKAEGLSSFYDRRWRDSGKTPPPGVPPVIRIKAPLEGHGTVQDQVQGAVTVPNSQLDDFIILRSDGTPTYMFSVVVDDHDMGVTHVIRGDDHLNNTFRQNVVYDNMGWAKPVYAHLPLILGPDGAKFSKRHGAASVEEYRDMGYLPEAMRNYLLRLGWSHGDEEIISTEQAVAWFDLDHVGKSPARFDFAKLESLNAHYMQQAADSRLVTLLEPFLQKKGLSVTETARKRLLDGMRELKTRAKTLAQMADESAFYCRTIPYHIDEKAQMTLNDAGQEIIGALRTALGSIPKTFAAQDIEAACKQIASEKAGGKLGKIAMPLRAALTGTTVSPSIFHAAEILGQEETLARLDYALGTLAKI